MIDRVLCCVERPLGTPAAPTSWARAVPLWPAKKGRVAMVLARVLVPVAVLVATVPGGVISAQQASPGGREPEPWFTVESFELSNGVRVHFVRRPLAHSVAAGWAVRSGIADDPVDAPGVAHMVEHLLFQGSQNVGTRDWQREKVLLERRDHLAASGASVETIQALDRQLDSVQLPNDVAKVTADASIVGSGALTTDDFSFFTGSFPPERFEAWLWIESDRIRAPALRGIEREKGVIAEETLQRSAAARSAIEVEFDSFFWGRSPYGRAADGSPADLARLSRGQALDFLNEAYSPDRLTVAVVGNLRVEDVRAITERYFGSLGSLGSLLSRGSREHDGTESANPGGLSSPGIAGGGRIESADTKEPPDHLFNAVPRGGLMEGSCDCRPSVRIRFATVAYHHEDAVTFDVLAAILNGRSGRLYLSLVASGDAFAAYASHKAQARAGSFSVVAEAAERGAAAPDLERLRIGLRKQLRDLVDPESGLREIELERAKNILRAEAAREVKSSEALRSRLLIDDALGDPDRLAQWPELLQSVSVEDVGRVLSRWLNQDAGVTLVLERSRPSRPGDAGSRE